VHVNVVLVKDRGVDPDIGSARLQVGQRRRRRLLHHIPELTGELELPLARRESSLDEDDLASSRRPHQTGGHAWTVDSLADVIVEPPLPKGGAHASHIDCLPARPLAHRHVRHGPPHH